MQRTTFDTQLLKEHPDPPATAVNGHGQQFRFMLHVIRERFDLLRPGSEGTQVAFQTSHKLKPLDSKLVKAMVAICV